MVIQKETQVDFWMTYVFVGGGFQRKKMLFAADVFVNLLKMVFQKRCISYGFSGLSGKVFGPV